MAPSNAFPTLLVLDRVVEAWNGGATTPSSAFPVLLVLGTIVLTCIVVIGYIVLTPTKKGHQREADKQPGDEPNDGVIGRIETHQMPANESGGVPHPAPPNQYWQLSGTEAAHYEQAERTKEGEIIEPSTSLALPRGVPEKYVRLAAKDRAFYDGIMKLFSLGLDDDLLYEGMETLWKKYNKKQSLN